MSHRTFATASITIVTLITITAMMAGFSPKAPQDDAASQPAAVSFAIDPVHSTALFRVHHLGAGQFWGRFNTLDGSFTYADGSDTLALDVSIPIESIDTNNEGLDRHLKSPDFFNAREYETMSFKSTSAKKTGERTYKVTGEFTLRDTTKTIEVGVEWAGTSNTRMGHRCGLEATFTIKRSDYGVMYGVDNGMLGDDVRIIVGLEGLVKE